MDAYTRYMDGWISHLSLPLVYAEPTLDVGPLTALVLDSERMRDTLAKEPYYESQFGLLAVSLALRAYKLEKGGYPNNLFELIPDYLERIPDDPFAPRRALQYRTEQTNYVLYSVGPDRVDNGGTESTNRFFETNQKGDIRLRGRRPDRLDVKK
jgi:hypothetical protein